MHEIDGQQWPASFALSAREIRTAFAVGGIWSSQHADIMMTLTGNPHQGPA